MRSSKLGVWLLGARGAISVATMAGVAALKSGFPKQAALITETYPFNALPFQSWESIILGGYDIVNRSLVDGLQDLIKDRVFPYELEDIARRYLELIEFNICSADFFQLTDDSQITLANDKNTALYVVDRIRNDINRFREVNGLDVVIVINLTSTEESHQNANYLRSLQRWSDFKETLSRPVIEFPAGILYAVASLLNRCPFINFTPNLGVELPALQELAINSGVPHVGKDGKTGETLIKSVLAPMFEERAFHVLSWQGYNLLGNADGKTLANPAAKSVKIDSKDKTLRSILDNSQDLHTGVSIDYVPSLGDWKTAWDFIHFEGFLGTRMSMQFTWQGCDTMLAVPLVLDLIRFVDLAARRNEVGHLGYLDCFFKSPTDAQTYDFRRQMDQLRAHFHTDFSKERL